MKYTTYTRYLPELADTLNLQALLDQLADFLLQSGFAGGAYSHPFWGEFVSSRTSHPCAMFCIQVPMRETPWPRKNSRKLRWASAPKRNPRAGASIAVKLAAVRYWG